MDTSIVDSLFAGVNVSCLAPVDIGGQTVVVAFVVLVFGGRKQERRQLSVDRLQGHSAIIVVLYLVRVWADVGGDELADKCRSSKCCDWLQCTYTGVQRLVCVFSIRSRV